MPRNELHYFDREENFEKGSSWYLSHFKRAKDDQVVGEKTPDYIWTNCQETSGISELKHVRIHEFCPDVRLIIIFRNPVERFVSAMHHNRRRGRLPARLGVGQLLEDGQHTKIVSRMLERGLYATQLKDYLEKFDLNQIKIFFHDDIKSNPHKILSETQAFLGIPLRSFQDSNERRYNDYQASEVGARLAGMTTGVANFLAIKFDRYLLSRFPLAKVAYPQLSEADRTFLEAYYQNDMQNLAEICGRSLPSDWTF